MAQPEDGVNDTARTVDQRISVVVPVYNEEATIQLFLARLRPVMDTIGLPWDVLFVDDGSSDHTPAILEIVRVTDSRVGVLRLSRNFGKEAALTAGMDHVSGDAVVVIDVDLQDPPELIAALVDGWREGFDVVYAQRIARDGDGWAKRLSAYLFYRVMSKIGPVTLPENVGDFRLLSRRAVAALLRLRERHRMMKGLFAWIGFPAKAVPYRRAPRSAGSSKWNAHKLIHLAVEGITGFTTMPLRLASMLGLATSLLSLTYGAVITLRTVLVGNPVPGYPSLLVAVLFLGGAQLMALGIIGEYLGRLCNEAKGRPLYLVQHHDSAVSVSELRQLPAADCGDLGR